MVDFTQANLDAINAAIASGELTVRYGDTMVTYRSLDELIRARDLISTNIGTTPRTTYTLAGFSKG